MTTYILCGGKSSRMNSDKALSIYKGQTFVSIVSDAVKHLDAQIIYVSSNTMHSNLAYTPIPDALPNKGPIAGIVSALRHTTTDHNLILSCDIPLITPELINWLITQHNFDYDGTVVSVKNKLMPLIAVYSKNSLATFEKHLLNDQLKLMTVLKDLHINYIDTPTHLVKQTTNINTVEQLTNITI